MIYIPRALHLSETPTSNNKHKNVKKYEKKV